MQKVVIHSAGNFDKLKLEEHEIPAPASGYAVVRTASIGVNFADCVVRMGLYASAIELIGWPITPGFEFSGVIESLEPGPNPQKLQVGDEVFGLVQFGAYASHVSVPLKQLFRLPPGLNLVTSGAISVATLTAWYALGELAALKPGAHVLVHSAAGGVGGYLVQMAKHLGATVVGVVGASHKMAAVQEMGADTVIDKSSENLFERAHAACPQGYDVILDANGVQTVKQSYRALRPTGRLILYGAHSMLSRGSGRRNWLKLGWNVARIPRFDPLSLTNDNKSVMGFNLSYLFDQHDALTDAIARISNWFGEGVLKVPAMKEYALSDVALAHSDLQSGTTIGKLTLIP